MKKILLSAFSIFLLTSCDKGTSVTYRVTNNSGEQITFNSYYFYTSRRTYKAILNNGDTRDILVFGKNTGSFESGIFANKYVDSIVATTNTDKRITKDLNNSDNWNKTSNAKQGTHIFTTEISSKDVQ